MLHREIDLLVSKLMSEMHTRIFLEVWMPRDVCHAKRVRRLWCDKKIKNEVEYIVRGFYMGRYEDIVWA